MVRSLEYFTLVTVSFSSFNKRALVFQNSTENMREKFEIEEVIKRGTDISPLRNIGTFVLRLACRNFQFFKTIKFTSVFIN